MSNPIKRPKHGDDSWRRNPRVASHWRPLDGGDRVECSLSPRHCKISNGQAGFCGVRRNINGVLYSENFGRAVAAAEEVIETEAIYHYRPGARILSMGNIGCMMACRFCQNWTTSQVRFLDSRVIQYLSPNDVIEIAKKHEINVISWTYNDPIVWHEFVMETSQLARDADIRTLFKSAMYIEEKPLAELLDVIDIWSVSLKSLDAKFYKKITGARIEPILERIQQVHASSRHLEISQLIVTDLNDTNEDVRKTIDWHLENLGEDIPLHFVRFHPAFKYLDVDRTPQEILYQAAEVARKSGIRHVYLGNLAQPGVSDTRCTACGATLVTRYGLAIRVCGIGPDNRCNACQAQSPIVEPLAARQRTAPNGEWNGHGEDIEQVFRWSDGVNSVHIQALDPDLAPVNLVVDHGDPDQLEYRQVGGGLARVLVSRRSEPEQQVAIRWQESSNIRVLPVADRAHLFTGDN